MSNLFLTLMIAFVIIILAIACLAIGWLITGKTKVEKAGTKDPIQKKDENCVTNSSCQLSSIPPKKSIFNKDVELKENGKA